MSQNDIPGGVYLCQIDEKVSCGACCGLYNVPNLSREGLAKILLYRTEIFASIPRTPDAITGFGAEMTGRIFGPNPYPAFHHCPYTGMIGPELDRPGCLLHPLGENNKGIDFRGLSHYGGMACRIYFCPTYTRLSKEWKQILRLIFRDWYFFGLMVTRADLITAVFTEAESRIGHPLPAEEMAENPRAEKCIRTFLQKEINGKANYFFEDGLYPPPPIPYESIGKTPSPFDTIFRELRYLFDSGGELVAAENRWETFFREWAVDFPSL